MSDPFENCVWEELTVEQLEERLKPEIKRGQEYLARKRQENTNPKHSYEDNGRYLMYMILKVDPIDDGRYEDFPQTNFTLKSYTYSDGLQEVCDNYYIDSIGHVAKDGNGMWLKTKRKNPE